MAEPDPHEEGSDVAALWCKHHRLPTSEELSKLARANAQISSPVKPDRVFCASSICRIAERPSSFAYKANHWGGRCRLDWILAAEGSRISLPEGINDGVHLHTHPWNGDKVSKGQFINFDRFSSAERDVNASRGGGGDVDTYRNLHIDGYMAASYFGMYEWSLSEGRQIYIGPATFFFPIAH